MLSSELARRGVRSHLVCGRIAGDLPSDLSSVHVVEGLASRRTATRTGAELATVLAGLDPDVIYVHNVFDAAVVSAVARLVDRGPLIWYVHDHYVTCLSELRWRRDLGSCQQRLGADCLVAIGEGHCVLRYPDRSLGTDELRGRLALSRSLAEADGIVVVSEYMRSLLADAEPDLADRFHLVPRPIRDLVARRLRDRDKPGDPAVITFAGRITPEKGLDLLIEALREVQASGPVELRVAGIVEHARRTRRRGRMVRSNRDTAPPPRAGTPTRRPGPPRHRQHHGRRPPPSPRPHHLRGSPPTPTPHSGPS